MQGFVGHSESPVDTCKRRPTGGMHEKGLLCASAIPIWTNEEQPDVAGGRLVADRDECYDINPCLRLMADCTPKKPV